MSLIDGVNECAMEIQQVRAFLAAGRTGGFGRAGASLGLTQPSISIAIRKLENELGVLLFERRGRRIKLTQAGEALLHAAEPLLQQWERLPVTLNDALGGELDGPVRIGVGIFTFLSLPPVFRKWRKRHPNARVVVRTQWLKETVEMLGTGEVDFGLHRVSSVPPGLFFKRLATFDRVLISAHAHPIAHTRTIMLPDLVPQRFVIARGQSPIWLDVERAFHAARLKPPHVALEGGALEVIKRYVALGLGLAVLPACCVEPKDRARLAVRSVRHLFGQDRFGVLVSRARPLSRAAREFIRLIDPEFPAHIQQRLA